MMNFEVEYILDVIDKLGYRKEEVMRDAIMLLLAVNRELREKVAVELYREGKISLGKACEISGLSYEEMKSLLLKSGVPIRRGPESVEELRRKAKELSRLL